MHVEGEFTVHQTKDRVWAFLADAKQFVDCLEDPHTVETTDETHFHGTVTTGVAFIRGTFRVQGEYTERTPGASLRARLTGTGMGSGLVADLTVTVTGDGGQTTVRWDGEMNLTGSVATVGERLVRGTVDKKVQGLFENARRRLEGPAQPGA